MRHLFLLFLTISSTLPAAEPTGWGHLKGQIVVEKMIEREPLIKAGAPIFAIQTLKEAQQGIPPKKIGVQPVQIPDPTILIDKKTGGLKNVFVYLQKAPATIHPSLQETPETPVEIRRPSSYECTPHAAFIRTGQSIRITNNPIAPCNLHTFPLKNQAANAPIPAGETGFFRPLPLSERIPIQVKDDLHPVVKAYWLVLDHPYAAISDVDGSFEIKNLAAGKYEFAVWHETVGFLEKKLAVEIPPDETTKIAPIKVTAKKLLGEDKPR